MINIIEECRASPPPCTVAELTLPVTYFDVYWLNCNEVQRLLFYKLPLITKSSFIETFIPKLKISLSLVLKHFLPLAGNSFCPLQDSDVPVLRYVAGDSVPLIFAESSENFDHLAGYQPRKCDHFYPLIPKLSPPYVSTNSKISPLFAVQVTVFPNSGISIGVTNHHGIGDASVIVGFVNAWASISKFEGDTHLLDCNLLPFYDRSVIKDPYDLRTKYLNHSSTQEWSPSLIPANMVRSTFVLPQSEIQELKNYVLRKRPALTRLSSFTVTCAYIWTCWFKSKDLVEETTTKSNEEIVENLIFLVDCRSRLDPPIPTTYFGNCILPCCVSFTREELVHKDGFLAASESIGAAILELVNDKGGILNGSVVSKLDGINRKRVIGVAGTTKNNIFEADFGWGKPEKFEIISIDREDTMSVNKSGREGSGLEVGLSMPEKQMEAFERIFAVGLGNLCAK